MTWKPDYVTLAEAKAYLRVSDAVDDIELAVWITAASRAIDTACNRQFGSVTPVAVRTYRRAPFVDPVSGMWLLEIDDVQDATGLLVGGVAYASSGYTLQPDNAVADGVPWTRLGTAVAPYPSYPGMPVAVAVTALWGWTAVPAAVKGAVRLQVARWAARRDSPFGVAGSPDQGNELRLLSKLDADIAPMLASVTRRRRVG